MAEYLANLSNGTIDELGWLRLVGNLFEAPGVLYSSSLAVSAQGTPDMSVVVAGAATSHDIVFLGPSVYYHGWNTANYTVPVTANNSGSTQIDAVVAYVDLNAGSTTANNPGGLKFTTVRGSGGSAPTSSAIMSAIGAPNTYTHEVLAHVTVANGASSINSGNIVDQRNIARLDGGLLANLSVTSTQLASNAVTTGKIDAAAVTSAKTGAGVLTNVGYYFRPSDTAVSSTEQTILTLSTGTIPTGKTRLRITVSAMCYTNATSAEAWAAYTIRIKNGSTTIKQSEFFTKVETGYGRDTTVVHDLAVTAGNSYTINITLDDSYGVYPWAASANSSLFLDTY